MAKFHSVFRRALKRCATAGCLITMLVLANVASAQQPLIEEPLAQPGDTPAATDEVIRSELAKLKNLEITQRKARARQLIAKYPDTQAAHLVQRYLDELELYDEAAQAQRAAADVRADRVRVYWKQRFTEELADFPNYQLLPLVRITNEADQAVLFQLRGYGMGWTRPLFLEAGATDEVNYPVEYRRITTEGTVTYTLQPGKEFVFRQTTAGGLPQLYEVPASH